MVLHGMVHWTELNTHDSEKAKAFFGATLGWTFDPMPMPGAGPYYICMTGDEMVGGMREMTDPQFDTVPEHWMTFFSVDDVDTRVAKAREMGGTVVREPFDVPGVGRIAIVQAPGGAAQGFVTPIDAG